MFLESLKVLGRYGAIDGGKEEPQYLMPGADHSRNSVALDYFLFIKIILIPVSQRPFRVSARNPNVEDVSVRWQYIIVLTHREGINASPISGNFVEFLIAVTD